MQQLNKQEFVQQVWTRIDTCNCLALDAIVDTATACGIDMETAGKIVKGNSALATLLETEAMRDNLLVKPLRA